MKSSRLNPVVHLELHTGDLPRASAFYSRLLRWHPDRIDSGSGSYLALELGGDFGVSFVHLASIENEDGHSPLSEVKAFNEFQANIGDRCDDPPVVTELSEIGSFRLFGD